MRGVVLQIFEFNPAEQTSFSYGVTNNEKCKRDVVPHIQNPKNTPPVPRRGSRGLGPPKIISINSRISEERQNEQSATHHGKKAHRGRR